MRRSDSALKRHNIVRFAVNRFQIFTGLLQLLRSEPLPGDLGRLCELWMGAWIVRKANLNRHHLAYERTFLWHN